MMKNSWRVLTAGLMLTVTLAGCSNDSEEPEEPASPESATTASTPSPSQTVMENPSNTLKPGEKTPSDSNSQSTTDQDTSQGQPPLSSGVQESEGFPDSSQGEGLYATGVRSAVHEGYDRIVIDHAGSGTPAYRAEYTDQPLAPGSGKPILGAEESSGTYLEINLTGMASHDQVDEAQALQNGHRVTSLDAQVAQDVVTYLPWEATSTYYIGVDQQRQYRVQVLEHPSRVVIDLAHD